MGGWKVLIKGWVWMGMVGKSDEGEFAGIVCDDFMNFSLKGGRVFVFYPSA